MGQIRFNFLIIVGSLIVGSALYFHQTGLNNNLTIQILELQKHVEILNSYNKIDSTHRENVARVLSVINRFNKSMPVEQKIAIASEISKASIKYDNLDVDLLCATITHESAFTWDATIVSPVGALGLMQVMPSTGKFLAEIAGIKWTTAEGILFNPVLNIRLGSRYLSSLIELYDVDGGLAAYNGGGRRAEMWLAQNRANGVLLKETQDYVPAVISLYNEFRN